MKQPEAGMGGTLHYLSDRYPVTIIEVLDKGQTVIVQQDDHEQISGGSFQDSHPKFIYKPNARGRMLTFSKRKNGRYYPVGEPLGSSPCLSIGERDYYQDPSF